MITALIIFHGSLLILLVSLSIAAFIRGNCSDLAIYMILAFCHVFICYNWLNEHAAFERVT